MAGSLRRDDQQRVCGYLEQDSSSQGSGKAYERYFFVLDTENNQFLYYSEDPKYTNHSPKGFYNINYMSMVEDAASFKSKNPLCLVLTVSGKSHYLKARNEEEKRAWVKELQNSARIQTPKRASSLSQSSADSLQAEMDGGVLVKQRIPSVNRHISSVSDSESEKDDNDLMEKYEQFNSAQRPLKTGYCTKQGVILKTWKRRWFVLADAGLAYYRSHEEKSAIRVIPKTDIIDARRSVGIHFGRENLFEVVTATRVFYVQAESSFDCDDWIQEIQNLLNPSRRKSEAIIQTEHSGSLMRSNSSQQHFQQVKYHTAPRATSSSSSSTSTSTSTSPKVYYI